MKVRVRLYAILRDLYGGSEDLVDLPEGSAVEDLISRIKRRSPRLEDLLERKGLSLIVLVNGLYAPASQKLSEGDVVDIMPPASGGCDEHKITRQGGFPSLGEILEDARRHAGGEGLGGLVIYVGLVKSPVEGSRVVGLEYEVHRDYTARRFEEIAEHVKKRHGAAYLRIYHVEGPAAPGDVAVLVAALGRGRREAFEAAREAVELVKHTTGIWKLERREDGEYWVLGDGERILRDRGEERA